MINKNISQKLIDKFLTWKDSFVVEEINLGLTNKNYILDQKWFLRKSQSNTKELTKRKNEINIINLLNQTRIGLKVYYYFWDQQENFHYITKFFPHTTTFKNEVKTKENLQKVAYLIKKLQKIASPKTLTTLQLKKNLLDNLPCEQKKLAPDLQKGLELVLNFIKTIKQEKLVLAHNDLVGENILIDQKKKYYLIDFEYCSLNIVEYDVAVFALENKLFLSNHLWKYWLKRFSLDQPKLEKKVIYLMFYRALLVYFWTIKTKTSNSNYHQYKKLREEKKRTINYLYQVIKNQAILS